VFPRFSIVREVNDDASYILNVMAVASTAESLHTYVGVYERILVLNGLVWFEAVAIKLPIFQNQFKKLALPLQ
jgi:hypothetical protein